MWFTKQTALHTLLWRLLNFMSIAGVQFHGIEFGNTKTFHVKIAILLSCQHFSNCAGWKMFRNLLLEFFSVPQTVSAISFTYAHFISKFQLRRSVLNGL